MATFHFPINEDGFENIVSYSPHDAIICQQKPFGKISAEEYLSYARIDIKDGSTNGLINSLSNAKRCFHYIVDRLLFRFCLRTATLKMRFPRKIKLLSDLNIIPGTLLRRFNQERNEMEHEYSEPTRDVVNGAIDLCELLLLATERFLIRTPYQLRIKFRNDNRDLLTVLELGGDTIKFYEILGSELQNGPNGDYYGGVLHVFAKDDLNEGLSIKRIEEDDIILNSKNGDSWMPILRSYTSIARESTKFGSLPDKPKGAITRYVELEMLYSVIDEMTKRNKKTTATPHKPNPHA